MCAEALLHPQVAAAGPMSSRKALMSAKVEPPLSCGQLCLCAGLKIWGNGRVY